MPVSSFSLNVSKFARDAKQSLEQTVKTVEIEMFSRVILRSPVDTGRFRGNWNVDQRLVTDKVDKPGAITIEAVTADVLSSEIGSITSLINALPYSEKLEMGHSKQAPSGMVRLVAMEFGAVVEEAARQHKV